jgi:hypothetical protein
MKDSTTILAHFDGDSLILELPASVCPSMDADGSWSFWLPADSVEAIRQMRPDMDEPVSIQVILADRPPQAVSGYVTHAGGDCQVFIDGPIH